MYIYVNEQLQQYGVVISQITSLSLSLSLSSLSIRPYPLPVLASLLDGIQYLQRAYGCFAS